MLLKAYLHFQRLRHPQQRDDASAVLRGAHHLRVDVRVQRAAVRLHNGVRLQLLGARRLLVSPLLHADQVPARKRVSAGGRACG